MDTYHITFEDGRWVLKLEGENEPVSQYSTKAEAELHSGEMLRLRGGALRIHKADGTIDEERTCERSANSQETSAGGSADAGNKEEHGWEEQPMPGLSPYTFHG